MLKRVINAVVQLFWTLCGPVRKPIARKIDHRINHMIAIAFQHHLLPQLRGSLDASEQSLARLETSIGLANQSAQNLATEMDLVMGGMLRDITRLQSQVETLQDLVEHAVAPGRNGLSIIRADDDANSPRSRVG